MASAAVKRRVMNAYLFIRLWPSQLCVAWVMGLAQRATCLSQYPCLLLFNPALHHWRQVLHVTTVGVLLGVYVLSGSLLIVLYLILVFLYKMAFSQICPRSQTQQC